MRACRHGDVGPHGIPRGCGLSGKKARPRVIESLEAQCRIAQRIAPHTQTRGACPLVMFKNVGVFAAYQHRFVTDTRGTPAQGVVLHQRPWPCAITPGGRRQLLARLNISTRASVRAHAHRPQADEADHTDHNDQADTGSRVGEVALKTLSEVRSSSRPRPLLQPNTRSPTLQLGEPVSGN